MASCLLLLVICCAIAIANAAPVYNVTDSLDMVVFSAISHCARDKIDSWTCDGCKQVPGFKVISTFRNEWTDLGFIGVDVLRNRIIASYIGTYNFQTVIQDFALGRTHFPNTSGEVLVHDGWYHGWMELRKLVTTNISNALRDYPTASVWVTGHSLGGSMAEICSVDLALQLGVPVHVYGFGTPRVGNTAWAELVEKTLTTHFRVTHSRDLIPLYPPRWAGYHHPATEIWYDNDTEDQYKVCNDSGEDPECIDSTVVPDIINHMRYLNRHITDCSCQPY
eukprot:TRINITY_DN13178_c0_g1_i2.p1 TRINITY_DN13178_c0_g1~~TRINITY_DN13178_c0_g1_i2.p1  ORF type:complete len:279 (+),score=26.82 TRINITY_DN13178_c0_g1_i2:85-921(+)